MSKLKIGLIVCVICLISSLGNSAEEVPYSLGQWDEETLGNHRAVVCVTGPADAVRVRIPWRRRDFFPEKKNIIIVDAATGKKVLNLLRLDINREFGDIVFQPQTVPGDYYVYYLVSKMEGRSNYPTVTYAAPEQTYENSWIKMHGLPTISVKGDKLPDLPSARVKEIQAIDELNSFYPMEVIATSQEIAELLEEYSQFSYLIFPEDRRNPIRMTDDLPFRWVKLGPQSTFKGAAARGEFYAFQIGVYACRSNIADVEVIFSPLRSDTSGETLPSSLFTSFNTTGTDWTGQTFDKICPIKKGKIQALWCGVQVPPDTKPGEYFGDITVAPQDLPANRIKFQLLVNEKIIKDAGDSEPTRHSRLRWLNSKLAIDDGLVPPYIPVEVQDRTLSCLGRNIMLGDMGFPVSIQSYFTPEMTGIGETHREVLAGPIQLIIEGIKGNIIPW
ncbi:MAG: glycoside hydrolase domain-containing protein, partial [Candidatus Aminicenantaceae bacterium]